MKRRRALPKATEADKKVFLDYHDTDDVAREYAREKLATGTAALTPEAILFMRGAIAERKAVKTRAEAVAKELEAEKRAQTDAAA